MITPDGQTNCQCLFQGLPVFPLFNEGSLKSLREDKKSFRNRFTLYFAQKDCDIRRKAAANNRSLFLEAFIFPCLLAQFFHARRPS
ncbi:hypothetical protein L598_006100000130 [Mesorhizobium sp. J18]|nr:hypothetical protein L598_006100000130 [Mesorhizobium sp. J18]